MKKFFTVLITLTGGGIAAIALLFIAGHFGVIEFYKPYVVLSGSMEPALPTGSVAFVLPKRFGYALGDIITFAHGRDNVTTHRIVSYAQDDAGNLLYQTQGDANDKPDSFTVTRDQVVGRVAFTIPYLGYLGDMAQTPQGFILLVIIPATIIVYEELKNLIAETKAQAGKLKARLKPVPAVVPVVAETPKIKRFAFNPAVILPVIGAFFVITSLSVAYFRDDEHSLSNVLGASDDFGRNPNLQSIAPLSLESTFSEPTPTPEASSSASPTPISTQSAELNP